jgi:hypothetical protein
MDSQYELNGQIRYDIIDCLCNKIKKTTDKFDFFLEIKEDKIKNSMDIRKIKNIIKQKINYYYI